MTSSLGDVDKVLGEVVDRVAITQQLDNIKEQLVQLKSKGGESIVEETRVAEVRTVASQPTLYNKPPSHHRLPRRELVTSRQDVWTTRALYRRSSGGR